MRAGDLQTAIIEDVLQFPRVGPLLKPEFNAFIANLGNLAERAGHVIGQLPTKRPELHSHGNPRA